MREFTGPFDVFFDLRLNKRLSKHSWGWWFETLSRPLWRHCNDLDVGGNRCRQYFGCWYPIAKSPSHQPRFYINPWYSRAVSHWCHLLFGTHFKIISESKYWAVSMANRSFLYIWERGNHYFRQNRVTSEIMFEILHLHLSLETHLECERCRFCIVTYHRPPTIAPYMR